MPRPTPETPFMSKVNDLRSQIEGRGVDSSQEPPNSETVAEKIKALEQAMRDLEPVNMLAIQEYDHVKTRYDFLAERRTTLSSESAKRSSISWKSTI